MKQQVDVYVKYTFESDADLHPTVALAAMIEEIRHSEKNMKGLVKAEIDKVVEEAEIYNTEGES